MLDIQQAELIERAETVGDMFVSHLEIHYIGPGLYVTEMTLAFSDHNYHEQHLSNV